MRRSLVSHTHTKRYDRGPFLTGLRVIFQRTKVSDDRIGLRDVLTPLGRWCILQRTKSTIAAALYFMSAYTLTCPRVIVFSGVL